MVSIILLAYNQEEFIAEAIDSCFYQTYAPLEIILSDDCSPDRTFEVMKERVSHYRGPHKIILVRSKANLGLAGNLNQALERTTGEFIVVAAGDDISVPTRVEKLVRRLMDRTLPVDLVVSYFEEINVKGNSTGFVKKEVMFTPDLSKNVFDWRCGATGACVAYRRKLYEKYGPLDPMVVSEDWVYSFRAWLESGIGLVEEPLVKHRTHAGGIAVMHRNISAIKDKGKRRRVRRQGAENQLGIAREWLKAWEINGNPNEAWVDPELRKLVSIRELEVGICDASLLGAIKLSLKALRRGGGVGLSVRLLARYLFRRY